ncbi:MAG: hypothetical protein K2H92_01395 [Bacteroidaceae bacterium]|nr:hypothetical protein [Bacteroidaceae bacterium]
MSPTSVRRCRGHRPVGVGDSDLEAVEAHYAMRFLGSHYQTFLPEDNRDCCSL